MQKEYIATIGTHNGRFHADDVCAVAVLNLIFPKAKVIRTRDMSVLKECDLRLDIGGAFNPETGDFDHHQPGGAGRRPNGVEYSSFGLIWRELGLKLSAIPAVHEYVDRVFVQTIDAPDNGQEIRVAKAEFEDVPAFDFSSAIDAFNRDWDVPADMVVHPDTEFWDAVHFVQPILYRVMARGWAIERCRDLLKEEVARFEDPRIIVLSRGCPWESVGLEGYPDARFVVFPDSNGSWRVQTIRLNPSGFASRRLLPESWAGLKDEEFAAVTGVPGAKFAHRKRFIAGAETREGAIALARLALDS